MTLGYVLGHADIQSDVPPIRGIWLPRAVLHKVSMAFGLCLQAKDDIQSDAKNPTPLEASGGQEKYYIR